MKNLKNEAKVKRVKAVFAVVVLENMMFEEPEMDAARLESLASTRTLIHHGLTTHYIPAS